jgi:hypothetical protein
MYPVKIETFSGSVHTVELPTKEAVNQFVEKYPTVLPKGIAVKISCDLIGFSGSIFGKANY